MDTDYGRFLTDFSFYRENILYDGSNLIPVESIETIREVEALADTTNDGVEPTAEELRDVFGCEERVRSLIEGGKLFPDAIRNRLQEVRQVVENLTLKLKQRLVRRTGLVSRQAAGIGKIYEAIAKTMFRSSGESVSRGKNRTDVYFLEDKNGRSAVVAKDTPFDDENPGSRLREEEWLSFQLFSFHVPENLIPCKECDVNSYRRQNALPGSDRFVVRRVFDEGNVVQKVVPIGKMIVKPFIEGIKTVEELVQRQFPIDEVFKRADRSSLLTFLFSGIYQTLDLHVENIGFSLKLSKSQQAVFSGVHFTIPSLRFTYDSRHKIDLTELALLFLDGKIDSDTEFFRTLSTGESLPLRKLKDDEELFQIVSGDWTLLLFDGEFIMGESNLLRREILEENPSCFVSKVSYRGDFLLYSWSDMQVPKDLLEEIVRERKDVVDWIDRQDAPIYRHLPKSSRSEIRVFVNQILSDASFNLSEHYRGGPLEDRTFIVGQFLQFIQYFEPFWEKVDSPNLKCRTIEDRTRLGKQLFPRLTFNQRLAWQERVDALKNYLSLYERLENLPESSPETREVIGQLLDIPVVSSVERSLLIADLETCRNTDLKEQKMKITNRYLPTYGNVVRSMYPLLADAEFLAKFLNRQEESSPEDYARGLINLLNSEQEDRSAIKHYVQALTSVFRTKSAQLSENFIPDSLGRLFNQENGSHLKKLFISFKAEKNVMSPWFYGTSLEYMIGLAKELSFINDPVKDSIEYLESQIKSKENLFIFI